MPVVAIILLVAAVVVGAAGLVQGIREHRTPRELRGDWWAQFEREFRAYANRTTPPTRDRRNQLGGQ